MAFTVQDSLDSSYSLFDDGGTATSQLGDSASSVSRIGIRLHQPVGDNAIKSVPRAEARGNPALHLHCHRAIARSAIAR